MYRCDKSAGPYQVTLRVAHHSEPYRVQIVGHGNVFMEDTTGAKVLLEEAAWVGTTEPWEGELCIHELHWLESGVPGKDYRPEYEFTVTKL